MSESFSQRQINILTALPFKNTNSAAANQRHILLYGINSTLNPEENTIHTLVTRLSDKLPYLAASNLDNNNGNNSNNNSDAFQMNGTSALATRHDDQANSTDANLKSRRTFTPVAAMTEPLIDDATLDDELQLELDEDTVTLLKDSSRYCQVYITRQWLMPLVKQFVVKEVQIGLDNWRVITSPGSSLLNARQLATIINIMEIVQDTRTLIELVLWVIDHTEDQAMCILCIDTLLRHDTCIMALQWQTKVFDVIATKYARLGIKSCGFNMMNSLKRLISRGYGTVDQVKAKLADPEFTLLMTNTSGGLSANSSLPPLPSNTSASTSNPLHSSYATPNTVAAGAAMATTTATSNLILLPDQISDMRFQPLILDTRQVATLAQSIWFKYHMETNWFTRLLDSLNVSLDEHAESLYDPVKACQKLQVFANLIGYLMRGDIALRHLLQQWINDRVMTDQTKLTSAEHRKWRLLLLLTLIARDSFDLIYSLEKIVNPLLTSITNDTQQQAWDKALVADLLNWLSAVLLQKSSSFVQLSIEESLLLETRICTQIEQLTQCSNILSLLIPLTKLEMALPLSDALRHQCHGLRHQLLKANWFKQACLSDPMSFVNYLVQQKSETTRESFMLILQSGLIMTGAPGKL
ncbi:hypothetical protein BDF22DRAFT_156837 [Syncephalis plumigaleata]|nr:hypothetical protein BDF22DRAFT_156837 [Syncephalis plumigaleata]